MRLTRAVLPILVSAMLLRAGAVSGDTSLYEWVLSEAPSTKLLNAAHSNKELADLANMLLNKIWVIVCIQHPELNSKLHKTVAYTLIVETLRSVVQHMPAEN